jgi:hypothetical protein
MNLRRDLTTLLTLLVVGCGAPPPDDGTDPTSATDDVSTGAAVSPIPLSTPVCAAQAAGRTIEGEGVLVCNQLHAERPFIRPPADSFPKTGSATVWVAASISGGLTLVDRTGREYKVVDTKGAVLNADAATLPVHMHMPSAHNMFVIYRVTGPIGSWTDEWKQTWPTIHLTSLHPEILIPGKIIDDAFPVWEGTVSERIDAGHWDPTKMVPIRVRFSSLAKGNNLVFWEDSTQRLADGATYFANGVVDNMKSAVLGADGSCLPPLAGYGNANPFGGAKDDNVMMFRESAMHFGGDEQTVLQYPTATPGLSQTGMGGLTALSPANFILEQDVTDWNEYSFVPHGLPTGHLLKLHPAMGGGGACTAR